MMSRVSIERISFLEAIAVKFVNGLITTTLGLNSVITLFFVGIH